MDLIKETSRESAPPAESLIRVGVILPEDERTKLNLVLPTGSAYELSWAGGAEVLNSTAEPGLNLEVTLANTLEPELSVPLQSGASVLRIGEWLNITSSSRQRPVRGNGIRVCHVPAGRSFHFRKQVDQDLLGRLHVHRQDARVVLVNEVRLEDYVASSLASEMSGDAPSEFLKAQAVAVRSWARFNSFGKHGVLFTHCNDVLTDAAVRAVEETRGEILVNDDSRPVNAFYSKCCGGIASSPAVFRKSTRKGPGKLADLLKGAISRRISPGRFINFDRNVVYL